MTQRWEARHGPVFAFFDENMSEVARFIERPPRLTEQLEKAMLRNLLKV